MIRNLRKPTDYAKAVMTQDELLKTAIANDANIAKARQEIRLGIPPPVPDANLKTAEELALDIGKQESDAVRNLLDLGFRYDDASKIVASLTGDEMFKLNQNIPAIKSDFSKKYDIRLITPTFFIDFLKKYIEELDASKGVSSGYGLGYIKDKFDELIDTTNELRAVIPTKDQVSSLEDVMRSAFNDLPDVIIRPIMERLEILNTLLPDGEVYGKLDEIQRDNPALAYKLNQELQNALQGLPSREQFERILMDIQDRRISNEDALRKIEDSVNDMDASQTSQLAQIIGLINDVKGEVREGKYVSGEVSYATELRIGDDEITFGISALDNKTIVRVSGTGELIKQTKADLDALNNFYVSQGYSNPHLSVRALAKTIKDNSIPNLVQRINSGEEEGEEGRKDVPSSVGATTTEGFGVLKRGTGLAKRTRIRVPKVKVGVGIADKREPPYRQLGKYVIHWKQLNDNDMLNVKYKSLGRIPQFKPIPISDVFKDYLVDVMETGKHNNRHYESIPVEERKIWEKIVNGAGLAEQLKIKKTKSNEDESEMERFEMLKGQYIAGNNNPNVVRELRRFVVKFLGDGRLKRNQALDLLLELSV
jgi:hypothetical protein